MFQRRKILVDEYDNKHYKINESREQRNIEKRPTVRRAQEAICGKKCFLLPEEQKFPICDLDCRLNYIKLHAAYVRAREWKYDDVAKKARRMLLTYDYK